MSILIKNTNLISMADGRPKIEESMDVFINNNIIEKITKGIEPKKGTKVIEGTGKVTMPGLINTHAHVAMSIFRETLDGYNLQEWLENKIWPMEDKLIGKDIYYGSYLSFIEMIRNGCTCINDMYFLPEYSIKAAVETGVRLQTTRTLFSSDVDKRLAELKDLINKYKDNDTISINVGIHGLYTTNEDDLKKILRFAKKQNLHVHMHFCENNKEVQDIITSYNVKNPVDVIEKYFKDIPAILAHCVKLTDKEIEDISKYKNISISHCPVSNLKLGCGVAKIQKMIDNDITVSLGTDGQGSGSNLDMFETMKFTALLQKGINENPKDMPAYEVLKFATINGAKALNLENKIGSIEEGKCADLIVVNIDKENMKPLNNIFANIVYNAKGTNVETSIVNGKVLMENRKINYIDEKKIYNECEKIIKRINNKQDQGD